MSEFRDEVELLSRIPFFSHVDGAKLRLMAFMSQKLHYQPGEELFHQGDAADAAYVVLTGGVEVLINTPQGEMRVAELLANEIIGEIGVLCDIHRTATVRAQTQTDVLCISRELFLGMLKEFPDMALEMMRELAHRLEQTTLRYRQAASQVK